MLPTRPLHQMYAEPARDFIESHGGEVRVNALRADHRGARTRARVEVRGERIDARRVIAAVPWFALRGLFAASAAGARADARGRVARWTSMPIVTVNLWYDRHVMDEPFVGLPGRDDAVGLRQAARVRRERVAPVARLERRDEADAAWAARS